VAARIIEHRGCPSRRDCLNKLRRDAVEITQPNGSKIRRTSSDPGRALLTGVAGFGLAAPQDDWNKFDVTGLRGLRHTAPYFHNNSAATLEEVVDHYTEVFKRAKAVAPPGVVPPLLSTDGVHFDRPSTLPYGRMRPVEALRTHG
jgi:cytochrome c peroxidase